MIINGKDISSLKNIATGTDSLTIDGVATSSKKAINIGKQSSATADYTVAIGNALASKKYATAVGGALEGYTTTASGQNSTAIGGGAKATGQNSTAVGDRSVSANHLTIAIGSEANAQNGICVGSQSSSNGSFSVSLGTSAVTNANYAIQIGRGSNATANTLNVGLSENNNYTLLESNGTIPNARLKNTVLINTATGTNSITVGGMVASNNNAINIGKSSISTIDGVAIGYSAQVNSANGTAIGSGSNVNAIKSTAIGYGAVTTAQHAIQLGYGTNATADTLSVGFYDETTPANSKNYTLLNASGIIPIARLGATSGDANKFLKGDGTWAEGSSVGSLTDIANAGKGIQFKLNKEENYEVIGEPTITSAGVLTNCTEDDYIEMDGDSIWNHIDLGSDYTVYIKFNTGSWEGTKNFWLAGVDEWETPFKFYLKGSVNSGIKCEWDFPPIEEVHPEFTCQANTDYWIKFAVVHEEEYTPIMTWSYSTDGVNYTDVATYTNDFWPITLSYMKVGCNTGYDDFTNGSKIYLSEFKIEQDSEIKFRAFEAYPDGKYGIETAPFIGTNGNIGGQGGGVPAPTIDDANKFLKSNGTWAVLPIGKYTENNSQMTPTNNVCTWTIYHGLGTKDVQVSVYDLTSNVEPMCNIEHEYSYRIKIKFNSSETIPADRYRVVIIG